MSRVTDRKDWQMLWIDDKMSILQTMRNNVASDIKAGYDLLGYNVHKQMLDIIDYERKYSMQMTEFGKMTDTEVNKWCYYDMKRRGIIS